MGRRKADLRGAGRWQGAVLPAILYGTLLAIGALALSWLDYARLARSFPGEIQILLIAVGFMGFGIWVGARLFARRPAASEAFDGNPAARRVLRLSEREMEVLQLIADGLSNKEIAARLHVSPHTVKTHVARLLEKLEVSRRTAALARARALGLLP